MAHAGSGSNVWLWPLALLLAAPAPSRCQALPSPTLRANVEEVSLELVVRDRRGRIVRDLVPGDLRIANEGTPVKVTSLRFVPVEQPSKTNRRVALLFDALSVEASKLARQAAEEMVRGAGESTDFAVLAITPRMRLVETFTHDRSLLARAVGTATEARANKSSPGRCRAAGVQLPPESWRGQRADRLLRL